MKTNAINVLLIEDNPVDARMVSLVMRESGVPNVLFHASTFSEGLDILDKTKIHFILLDCFLPDSFGMRTILDLQDKYPNVPFLVIASDENSIKAQLPKSNKVELVNKSRLSPTLLRYLINFGIERKEMEEMLADKEQRLNTVSNQLSISQQIANAGLWKLDILTSDFEPSQELLRVLDNRLLQEVTSLRDYKNLIYPNDLKIFEDGLDEVIKTGNKTQVFYNIIKADGTLQSVFNWIQPFVDAHSGKLVIFGLVAKPVARPEEEGKTEADSSSSFRRDLFQKLAFQTKTPLNSLVNLTHIFSQEVLTNQQNIQLNAMKSSLDELIGTISDMINLSLITDDSHSDKVNFKLRDVVQNSIRWQSKLIQQKNAIVTFDIDEGLPETLNGESIKVQQLLYNALLHSLKLLPQNGKIEVEVRKVNTTGSEVTIDLVVKDNGKGYSPIALEKVMLSKIKDYELDSRELFLLTAQKITNLLGGFMSMKSTRTNTLTAQIILGTVKTPKEITGNANLAISILAAEDHFLNQLALKRVIESWSPNIKLDMVDNGLKAVRKLENNKYDIILMDLQMPEMDGLEAVKEIRKKDKTTPIVAITASSSERESEKCKAMGFTAYLSKPYRPDELYSCVLEAIG